VDPRTSEPSDNWADTTHTTTTNTEVCVIDNTKPCCIVVVSVFGAIAVCLFPLWPPEVRLGVYYLSVAAAGFVGLIFVLCISKFARHFNVT